MKLENKIILITGGSRGIGFTTAKLFVDEGATVIITSKNQEQIDKAKEELRQQMSEIIIDTTQKILGDEISPEKHDAILKKAAEEL